jgi:hypothetical protein
VFTYVQYAAGNLEAARAAASEFIEIARGVKVEFVGVYAGPLCGLGFREETAALLADGLDEYDRVAHRASSGDYVGAADEFARMSLPRMEAEMRLLAAQELVTQGRQAEADAQVERALKFFEPVKAAPYVKTAQALLAATA